MSDVDIHHLAAAYALDAVDEHERTKFEEHYESCDVCRADVVELRRTMARVAEGFATPPPSAVKQRVLAEITATRQVSPAVAAVAELAARRPVRRAWWTLAAAAAVVLVVVSVVAVTNRDGSSFESELALVMEQPDAKMLHLSAQGDAAGSFKVAWSGSMGEAVLMGDDLPPAPSGKAYELWWFPQPGSTSAPASPNADGRLAMYVLDPAVDGSVHRVVHMPETPAAWAITLEPAKGAAVTTGDVMFIAEA